MKKLLIIVAMLALSGCTTYSGHMEIREDLDKMNFTSEIPKTNSELMQARTDCKNLVVNDDYYKKGVWNCSINFILGRLEFEFQDCMAGKGFQCEGKCAYMASRGIKTK